MESSAKDEYDIDLPVYSIDTSKLQESSLYTQVNPETFQINLKPRIIKINEIEDIASSEFNSLTTPLVSEELLINEKLDFLPSESCSLSDNYSLTYTKTVGSEPSSSFGGLRLSNFFLNSSPQSLDQSFFNTQQDFENVYRKIMRSHTEAGEEYFKIPNLTLQAMRDERVKVFIEESLRRNTCEEESERVGREKGILCEEKEVDWIEESLAEDLGTTGRIYEAHGEKQGGFCSCGWCAVV